MPPDNCLWLDDDQCLAPLRPPTHQRHPKNPVCVGEFGALGITVVDRELLSQCEVLQGEFTLILETRNPRSKQGK